MDMQQKLISIAGLVVMGVVVALAFSAYLSPSMLFEFVSMHLCS